MTKARTILLAEDNPADAELTLFSLRQNLSVVQIDVVEDGVEVLNYLGIGPDNGTPQALPALILLDLKMPRMDGLAVLRTLKSHPLMRRIPAVMLTSSQEPRDVSESYELGANAYVVKTMDFKQFNDALNATRHFWIDVNHLP
jgi:two-component system response regulator